MANLYIFFDKRSPRKDGSGTLKLAISHNHQTIYESLGIRVKPEEWDSERCAVVSRPDMKFHNIVLRKRLSDAEVTLQRLMLREDFPRLTARDLMTMIMRGTDTADEPEDMDYLLPVYNEYITLCKKANTASIYKASLKNLKDYEPNIDTLRFKDINVAWLRKYQLWLTDVQGMSVNGANVYLRNLRTIFNYAISNEMTAAKYPFKSIDMTTEEPDKRYIPYEKFIEWATYPVTDRRVFYREIFMLSFYLCGIRPTDLLHLKKSNVIDGRLVYKPEKLNGRVTLSIKIEPEAMAIINKYAGEEYLLNILDSREDYKAFCKHWNAAIKAIGEDIIVPHIGRKGKKYTTIKHKGVVPNISAYYARSCWASIAYNQLNTPFDVVSQALGHKSGMKVTNFYVRRDEGKVDKVNRALIDMVTKDMAERLAKQ